MRPFRPLFAAAIFSVLLMCGAQAQDAYPNKPVRVIVPWAPGGPADLIARIVSQKLSESLGKQFYIENHAGAGGNLGAGIAAHTPNDGYTLMMTSQAIVINPHLYKTMPYNAEKDFVAIASLATTPNVLVVHPDVPAKTAKELVELIRKDHDKYNSYAEPGIGTAAHLAGEMFKLSQKIELTAVTFNGGGPMVQSVIAGHTPIAFSSMPPSAPLILGGKMRALAITQSKRLDNLPDVPTMEEAGYPNQLSETPVGVLAPVGTPQDIVTLVNRKVNEILAQADTRQKLAAIGFLPTPGTPEQFTAFLKEEGVKWGRVIQEGKIALQ